MKKLYIVLLLVSICGITNAQGILKGKITDGKEPISYANISLYQGEEKIISTQADMNGFFTIKNIPAGIYDAKAIFVDYKPWIIKNVIIKDHEITYLEFKLTSETVIPDIIEYVKTTNSNDTASPNKKVR
jgi:hypothetical protein